MDNIAVFGHHRKKGVGTAIVLALVHEAQRRGAEYISLEVRPSKPAGRWGCTPSWACLEEGRRRNFYNDPTEDALILTPAFPKGGQGMIVLGIESSCDETAAALVEDGRKIPLSRWWPPRWRSIKSTAAWCRKSPPRRHSEAIVAVVQEALERGRKKALPGGRHRRHLRPGAHRRAAGGGELRPRGLSLASGLPLVPVHHLRGHIASGYLSDARLEPPFLCLVASGGHSHIVQVEDYTKLKILGRTRDDAAGEAFDKAARAMGIPYPGGVEMDRIAEEGDPNAYKLPHPHVEGAPLDFSFSGLKTAVLNLLNNARQKGEEISVPDLCASYRKAVVSCLTENFFKAAEMTGAKTLAAAGGVSANRLLRRELERLARERGLKVYLPDKPLCGDNAAMIASQGYYEYLAGNTAGMDLNACAQRSIE